MALLAEEIVEEWLNRQGYFTIRGIKVGVHEIDLLAVKYHEDGKPECRHIEVQASMRPVSYISRVPKKEQKTGVTKTGASRNAEGIIVAFGGWVETKFRRPDKKALMAALWNSQWSSELVVNVVKSEEELKLIAGHGIRILRLADIVSSLANDSFPVSSACGADIIDLIHMGAQRTQ